MFLKEFKFDLQKLKPYGYIGVGFISVLSVFGAVIFFSTGSEDKIDSLPSPTPGLINNVLGSQTQNQPQSQTVNQSISPFGPDKPAVSPSPVVTTNPSSSPSVSPTPIPTPTPTPSPTMTASPSPTTATSSTSPSVSPTSSPSPTPIS